jgi:hypothetical protein
VPAYGLNSPKAGIVGETERRAKLQMKVFKEMSPNLGFSAIFLVCSIPFLRVSFMRKDTKK